MSARIRKTAFTMITSSSVRSDTQFRQMRQQTVGLFDIFFETGVRIAVIAVRVERFERDRVDRVLSDERLDVFHIAQSCLWCHGPGED